MNNANEVIKMKDVNIPDNKIKLPRDLSLESDPVRSLDVCIIFISFKKKF